MNTSKTRLLALAAGSLLATQAATEAKAQSDPSFEAAGPAGPISSIWTQSSSQWGSPLCDGSCTLPGVGTLARTGNWFLWFGGTPSFSDSSFVRQSVPIPAGVSTFTFWFRGDSTRTDNADSLTVRVDGSPVLTITSNDVRPGGLYFGSAYQQITANIPGGGGTTRLIEFAANTTGAFEATLFSNFLIDDIAIAGGTCYANCDASSTPPVLGPADFSCFLAKFRAGDSYANCDASTIAPVLGPADFSCFLAKFRAGC